MAKDELLSDIIMKHNDLCDILNEMKLNPLADFESLKVDEDNDEDYNEVEDGERAESQLEF